MTNTLKFAFVILATCSWINGDYYVVDYDPYYQVPVYYHYSWEVKDVPSGNDYRQEETRDGHQTTGQYQVLLPGGRHQTVNYRVNKDSGFMADVSYLGESNYFTFKSNYPQQQQQQYAAPPPREYQRKEYQQPENKYQQQQQQSYRQYEEQRENYYPQRQEERQEYYEVTTAAPVTQKYAPVKISEPVRSSYKSKTPVRISTTTQAPKPKVQPTTPKQEWSSKTEPVLKEAPVVVESATVKPTEVAVSSPNKKMDVSKMAMYPLYRSDYYSARAKAGKIIPEPEGGYAVDSAGATYIKPAASYSVPDKLGTYEINHRKATVRKPSKSDYSAPEALVAQN